MSWYQQAACRGMGPKLFFPEIGSDAQGDAWEAKKVCAGCPVRTECLEQAQADVEWFGVWGGMTSLERRKLRGGRAA